MGSSFEKDLASLNILRIISTCARHKVATLKFGNLELSFSPQAETPRTEPSPGSVVKSEAHVIPPVTEITEQQQKNIARAALEIDELTLRDQQFAELLVTDPQAAEQMLVDGELDDVDGHGDDE